MLAERGPGPAVPRVAVAVNQGWGGGRSGKLVRGGGQEARAGEQRRASVRTWVFTRTEMGNH